MAITDRRNVGKPRPGPKKAEEANGSPRLSSSDPLSRGLNEIFRNDDVLNDAITANLKKRGVASQAIADRARVAFTDFSASRYSAAERERPNYLAVGDDLVENMRSVISKGTDVIRASTAGRSIRLRLTPDLKRLLKREEGEGESRIGTIDLPDLVGYLTRRPGAGSSASSDPTLSTCKAELEAERRVKEIEGSSKDGDAVREAGSDGAAAGDSVPLPAERSDGDHPAATKFVTDEVTLQMGTATSPETQVSFSVPQRSDQNTRARIIETFELRDGPSDVTSYHDFSSLQIAFEHVWTEIFDGELATLGQELYQEYVRLKAFTGADDGAERKISTLNDLSRLMDEIRELSRLTGNDLPGSLQPSGGSSATGDIPAGSIDLSNKAKLALDPFSVVSDSIKDETIRTFVDPAGAIIDAIGKLFAGKPQLNWESFPGPLPVSNDIIAVSFEEGAAAPGTVEIALANSPAAWWWKGIEFRELDASGNVVSDFKISNDPHDADVWDRSSYNVLRLRTPQLKYGLLEFKKAAPGIGFGVHTGYYLLAGLDQRIKDRTRVTFTWMKDS